MTDVISTLRGEIERAGFARTARLSGIDRASLHRAFGAGKSNLAGTYRRRKPSFTTIVCVAEALGFELRLARPDAGTQP